MKLGVAYLPEARSEIKKRLAKHKSPLAVFGGLFKALFYSKECQEGINNFWFSPLVFNETMIDLKNGKPFSQKPPIWAF